MECDAVKIINIANKENSESEVSSKSVMRKQYSITDSI